MGDSLVLASCHLGVEIQEGMEDEEEYVEDPVVEDGEDDEDFEEGESPDVPALKAGFLGRLLSVFSGRR